jgi:UPF0176 protein
VTAILNISAYRFTPLPDAAAWRDSIRSQAGARGLKGTVLLAEEGINLFLAGAPQPLRDFVAWLCGHAPFAALRTRDSWSRDVPFGRLLVKVKREIIRMNRPAIQPARSRAPAVAATTLARWLDAGRDDAGRPVITLDTRNAFEVQRGRFRGAIDWNLGKFSEFPDALLAHRDRLRGKTVVTYCTGGIRCEKAALFMAQAGVEHVLQLDGGILGYFEHTGGRHFDGHCVVFDARDALAPTLTEAAWAH